MAVVAHTIVIGATNGEKVTGRRADVILAAHYASQAALRLLKPGNETYAITDAVQKVAESFKCKPVEGKMAYIYIYICFLCIILTEILNTYHILKSNM